MKAVLLLLTVSSVFGASLRTEHSTVKPGKSNKSGKYDFQDAIEKYYKQFDQLYPIVKRELRGQILEKLYADEGKDITNAILPCIKSYNTVQKMMLVGASCMSVDTKEPLALLLQDVLQQLDTTSTCARLPVDMRPDLQNLIATGILQGLNFTLPWKGSLGLWRLVTAPPMEIDDLFYLYETHQIDLESPGDTSEWNTVLKELASNRTTDRQKIAKMLDLHLPESTKSGVRYSKILHDSLWYVYDAISTMCLFAKPLAEMIDVPRARISGS